MVLSVRERLPFRLAGDPRQLVERARSLLGDDAQKLAIASRQDLGEGFRRGEPHFRLTGRHVTLASSHRHRPRLHLVVVCDADFQSGHRITPLSQHRVHALPEVGEQGRGVPVLIRAECFANDGDGPAGRRASAGRPDGVVEPDQPLAVRAMQRERIVDTVRLVRRRRDRRHDEPDPVAALRVHHKNLSVELEKRIEGRIAPSRHPTWLSY